MSSSPAVGLCFNSNCKHLLESPWKGWRRRSGDFADLCHRCASAYEEGKFCETFHRNASGWRCCGSCGKKIHCGCIVSFHKFVLLDAGGIECIACAPKSFILTPNPAWPPTSIFLPLHSERIMDLSGKNWCHVGGSGPVPWRQAPSFFGSSCAQPDLCSRISVEVDEKGGTNRLTSSGILSAASFDKRKVEASERLSKGSLKLVASEKYDTGMNCTEQANLRVNLPHQPSFRNKDSGTPNLILPLSSATRNEMKDPQKVPCIHVPQPIPPHQNGKHCSGQCGTMSGGEVLTQNARPPEDSQLQIQSFPCQWPRINEHELQKISGMYPIVLGGGDLYLN